MTTRRESKGLGGTEWGFAGRREWRSTKHNLKSNLRNNPFYPFLFAGRLCVLSSHPESRCWLAGSSWPASDFFLYSFQFFLPHLPKQGGNMGKVSILFARPLAPGHKGEEECLQGGRKTTITFGLGPFSFGWDFCCYNKHNNISFGEEREIGFALKKSQNRGFILLRCCRRGCSQTDDSMSCKIVKPFCPQIIQPEPRLDSSLLFVFCSLLHPSLWSSRISTTKIRLYRSLGDR